MSCTTGFDTAKIWPWHGRQATLDNIDRHVVETGGDPAPSKELHSQRQSSTLVSSQGGNNVLAHQRGVGAVYWRSVPLDMATVEMPLMVVPT
jgi:hypothetical protein